MILSNKPAAWSASLLLSAFSLPATTLADTAVGELVVVTASRTDQAPGNGLARVSVIARDAIERSQAPDLLELLRLEAGVDIARAGGPGGQTSVFLRGTNSNHVLVLIDGVRVSAAGTGGFAWETLDPAIIERIEIVRGPRAARWGSDALGGVIQIFTRRETGTLVRGAYGRYRDRALSAATGTPSVGLSASARRVGGFSAQNERGFAFDPDDDGFVNQSAALNGQHQLAGGLIDWSARVATGEVEFDQGESEHLNYSGRVGYRHSGAGPWLWSADLASARDRLETETAFGTSEFVTRRIQSSAQAERTLSPNQVWLIGVDAWRESGVSRNEWRDGRYNIGLWTGIDGQSGVFDYEASLRIDEDELFGSAVTGSLAGGWRLADNARVFASLGRGFRAPTFNQLFSPGFSGLFAGNPDLDPETAWSAELGGDWQPAPGHRLYVSLFRTDIEDLIDFAGIDFQAVNVRKARIEGSELGWDFRNADWIASANFSWQRPRDRDSGAELLRRPRQKASLGLDRLLPGNGWIGGEVVFTGSRRDIGQEKLPDYTLVNLRAGYPLVGGLRLEARLENLTDHDYEPLVGFNAHRRSLFVALSWEG